MAVVTLYRPVGLRELELIAASGWKRFPPRLEWQPIFYPVLERVYAEQIALEWNTRDSFSGFLGAVTAFVLPEAVVSQYEVREVGGMIHRELWIPAGELEDMNDAIVGEILLVRAYIGKGFSFPEDVSLRKMIEDVR
ncbi:MAG TPA: hypothetical protein VL547_12450 [Dinghuibacter sp.]|jgi:hypothetical protein|uniref:ADP-ribosylation/crystallin J1 n=1 Tax=Dinghuibacter sp. TaxID=2024697 RepID=UPI002D0647B5|nr:ADP-ribosylation/crystallin J1 [Dinghuibacter sp.]HTJ12836.1 hypothetical protein [Dinghuibacter sp.]